MPYKNPDTKRLYMREYTRKRREDPEFRKIANARTVQSRKNPKSAKKHAIANARYREKYPERVKISMQRVDALPHRVASRVDRQAKWLAKIDKVLLRAFQKNWRLTRTLKVAKNGGVCTLQQWIWRCRLYGNCCAYCGSDLANKAEMDHVIPVAKGGTGWPSNLVPACRSCNARKNTARWRPRLPISRAASGQTMPRLVTKES